MKVIYKYELNNALNYVEIPVGAEFLAIAQQNKKIQAWFLCPLDAPYEMRSFAIITTGMHIANSFTKKDYLGTIMTSDHSLVFHIFEVFP